MAYRFKHIFCATAAHLEPERGAFHEVLAELNQAQAMEADVPLVPVSLSLQMADKRVYQQAIDWNIRQSSVYFQVFDGSWGPPQRNFEEDYALAMRCAADPAFPMQKVAMLSPKPIEEFKQDLRLILQTWLQTITSPLKAESLPQ